MGDRRAEKTRALRALAHPLTVASLVLLVLNDHVLKQAWPGWVTGKLSDVVGLVVAPPLLAVGLALLGVRRPQVSAVVLTGIGFVVVKTTGLGSDLASDVWSAVGWPSYLRRDPTDLLALPALLVTLRVHRLAADPPTRLRRRATATVGALVLPFAVLATAATSPCAEPDRQVSVGVLEGKWGPGGGRPPVEMRAVFDGRTAVWQPVGEPVRFAGLSTSERERITGVGPLLTQACDPGQPRMCWRVATRKTPTVEATTDGGEQWELAQAMPAEKVAEAREQYGEPCGEPVEPRITDLAVLPADRGVLVLAAVSPGVLMLRDIDGTWQTFTSPDINAILEPWAADPDDALSPVEPTPRGPSASPSPAPTEPPSPDCPSPSWVTVTPDPRNGPPTVQPQCDIASGP